MCTIIRYHCLSTSWEWRRAKNKHGHVNVTHRIQRSAWQSRAGHARVTAPVFALQTTLRPTRSFVLKLPPSFATFVSTCLEGNSPQDPSSSLHRAAQHAYKQEDKNCPQARVAPLLFRARNIRPPKLPESARKERIAQLRQMRGIDALKRQ